MIAVTPGGRPDLSRRSALGNSRRFNLLTGTSGLPPTPDDSGPGPLVSKVPTADLPATGVAQPIQKLFRRDQIGGAQNFPGPAVNPPNARDGGRRGGLIAQQGGEARCELPSS